MSAFWLRLIACVTMLIDHIGYLTGNIYLRMIGRLAFPIFVYLICNGYRFTSNKYRYALRIGVFALISQIPFSLFCYRSISFSHGNVMFTLLLGLLCIWSSDRMLKHRILKWTAFVPTLIVSASYYFGYISSDYGIRGILMMMVFFYTDRKKLFYRLLMLFGMVISLYFNQLLSCGWLTLKSLFGYYVRWPHLTQWDWLQALSLLSLVFVFLYNGKKGTTSLGPVASKALQYGFYAFYPAHMLILYLCYMV